MDGGGGSALQSFLAGQGGSSGGQSAGMQAWLNGHFCYLLPMNVRISTGLEQMGGFKGVNSPVFQLAGQLLNHGSSFGLGGLINDIKQRLSGGLENYAGDISDQFAALASMAKYDREFDSSIAIQQGLQIQSLPSNHIGTGGGMEL